MNIPAHQPPRDHQPPPRWETAVIGGSFLLLWAWWLARQAALREDEVQPLWWQGVLVLSLLALLFVLGRRIRRAIRALRGGDETPHGNSHASPPER